MGHSFRSSAVLGAALLTALGVIVSACSDGGPRELAAPSSAAPPPGSSTVSCELADADGSRLTFSFVLEDTYELDPGLTGSGCAWSRPAPPRSEDPTVDSVVVLERVGGESLSDVHDRLEPFVAEDGDDALSDLRLSQDVPVYGETVGDRLRWDCFCDGVPEVTYLSQAAGVRMTWSGSVQLQDQIEDEVRAALSSAGAG